MRRENESDAVLTLAPKVQVMGCPGDLPNPRIARRVLFFHNGAHFRRLLRVHGVHDFRRKAKARPVTGGRAQRGALAAGTSAKLSHDFFLGLGVDVAKREEQRATLVTGR